MDPDTRAMLFECFAFLLGAIVGSFLNVVIFRLPRGDEGLSVVHPRLSICPKCRATIPWYDNIPLLSYFLLLGKCRACKVPIPLRYFGVELMTAVLYTIAAMRLGSALATPQGMGTFAVQAALLSCFVAITFIDIDHYIIPDEIDLPGIALAPLVALLLPELHTVRHDLFGLLDPAASPRLFALASSGLGIVVGGGILLLIRLVGTFVFKKEAMGLGDVKLLAMIGGYVGWQGVLLTLVFASFAGAGVGIIVKIITSEAYIPFGPFLVLGATPVVLARPEIMEFVTVTYPIWVQTHLMSRGASGVGGP